MFTRTPLYKEHAKANLDIFWLKDDSIADTENFPKPAVEEELEK